MDALVVGAGSMGRWIGEVLHQADRPERGLCTELHYVDRRQAVAEQAADETGVTAVEVPENAYDVVCVAVPIPATPGAIASHAERASRAVIDVAGTMKEPVAALREHAPHAERCSLHPLFAPSREPGNVPAVVDRGGPVTRALRGALEARGNRVFETTPQEHDEMMETVQARAHAALLAFGLAGEDVPDRFQTATSARLSELVDRLSGGTPRVYADIQNAFDGAEDVAAAATRVASADDDAFLELYEEIARER